MHQRTRLNHDIYSFSKNNHSLFKREYKKAFNSKYKVERYHEFKLIQSNLLISPVIFTSLLTISDNQPSHSGLQDATFRLRNINFSTSFYLFCYNSIIWPL